MAPPVNSFRSIAGNIAALVAGGLVLFLEMWTIVPAPNLQTLALAVVIPELGPWGVALSFAAAAVAQFGARGWARTVGVACAAFAVGCALVPWCLLPSTLAHNAREMQLGLGMTHRSQRATTISRLTQPYSLRTAIFGYPAGATVRVRLNLEVRTRDGTLLGLDVYAPRARGPRPTIIIIYGGAWIFGSRADSAAIARSFAGQGYTAIAIDYRHAPMFAFPTQSNDVADAISTIARNATAWDVDVGRVAILGRSAGAQLALLAAYAPQPVTVRAAIGYYAPTDLVMGYRVPPRPDPADVDRILRAYTGGTPDERFAVYRRASPIAHVRPGLPPTLLVGGGRDELVRLAFAHQLRDSLRLHGVRAAALDIPWSNHAFDSVPNGTGGQIARYYTQQFLIETL